MRFVKTTSFILFVFLLAVFNTIIVCDAKTYTDSDCGASFSIPDTWQEESWRVSADAKGNTYGSRDGCVVYSAEFVPKSESAIDHNIRFGYKDLMPQASGVAHAKYQTADFVAEIESLRDDSSQAIATLDESKRVITDNTDKVFLSMLSGDEHEMMTIGTLEYARFDEHNAHIYVHVHNGVVYQFKEQGAEEEIKELLASAKYPDRVQIKPTESTTKKHSKNSSVVSFKGLFYAGFFVLIIVVAMIKRRVANPRDKSNVISIRMADSDTDDGDDSDAEEDSSDKEKE